jgi:hypothetical protein
MSSSSLEKVSLAYLDAVAARVKAEMAEAYIQLQAVQLVDSEDVDSDAVSDVSNKVQEAGNRTRSARDAEYAAQEEYGRWLRGTTSGRPVKIR